MVLILPWGIDPFRSFAFLCVGLSFTAPEMCPCQLCYYGSGQFFLAYLLPILGRRGAPLPPKISYQEPQLAFRKFWSQSSNRRVVFAHRRNPITIVFSKFYVWKIEKCKLDLPSPFPTVLSFPNQSAISSPLLAWPLSARRSFSWQPGNQLRSAESVQNPGLFSILCHPLLTSSD